MVTSDDEEDHPGSARSRGYYPNWSFNLIKNFHNDCGKDKESPEGWINTLQGVHASFPTGQQVLLMQYATLQLKGTARTWYDATFQAGVPSFPDFMTKFRGRFCESRDEALNRLNRNRQEAGERVADYADRFRSDLSKAGVVEDYSIKRTFLKGLHPALMSKVFTGTEDELNTNTLNQLVEKAEAAERQYRFMYDEICSSSSTYGIFSGYEAGSYPARDERQPPTVRGPYLSAYDARYDYNWPAPQQQYEVDRYAQSFSNTRYNAGFERNRGGNMFRPFPAPSAQQQRGPQDYHAAGRNNGPPPGSRPQQQQQQQQARNFRPANPAPARWQQPAPQQQRQPAPQRWQQPAPQRQPQSAQQRQQQQARPWAGQAAPQPRQQPAAGSVDNLAEQLRNLSLNLAQRVAPPRNQYAPNHGTNQFNTFELESCRKPGGSADKERSKLYDELTYYASWLSDHQPTEEEAADLAQRFQHALHLSNSRGWGCEQQQQEGDCHVTYTWYPDRSESQGDSYTAKEACLTAMDGSGPELFSFEGYDASLDGPAMRDNYTGQIYMADKRGAATALGSDPSRRMPSKRQAVNPANPQPGAPPYQSFRPVNLGGRAAPAPAAAGGGRPPRAPVPPAPQRPHPAAAAAAAAAAGGGVGGAARQEGHAAAAAARAPGVAPLPADILADSRGREIALKAMKGLAVDGMRESHLNIEASRICAAGHLLYNKAIVQDGMQFAKKVDFYASRNKPTCVGVSAGARTAAAAAAGGVNYIDSTEAPITGKGEPNERHAGDAYNVENFSPVPAVSAEGSGGHEESGGSDGDPPPPPDPRATVKAKTVVIISTCKVVVMIYHPVTGALLGKILAVLDTGASQSAITLATLRMLGLESLIDRQETSWYTNADGRETETKGLLHNLLIGLGSDGEERLLRKDMAVTDATSYQMLLGTEFLLDAGATIHMDDRTLTYRIPARSKTGTVDILCFRMEDPQKGEQAQESKQCNTMEPTPAPYLVATSAGNSVDPWVIHYGLPAIREEDWGHPVAQLSDDIIQMESYTAVGRQRIARLSAQNLLLHNQEQREQMTSAAAADAMPDGNGSEENPPGLVAPTVSTDSEEGVGYREPPLHRTPREQYHRRMAAVRARNLQQVGMGSESSSSLPSLQGDDTDSESDVGADEDMLGSDGEDDAHSVLSRDLPGLVESEEDDGMPGLDSISEDGGQGEMLGLEEELGAGYGLQQEEQPPGPSSYSTSGINFKATQESAANRAQIVFNNLKELEGSYTGGEADAVHEIGLPGYITGEMPCFSKPSSGYISSVEDIKLGNGLTSEQEEDMRAVLRRYSHIFTFTPQQFGCSEVVMFDVKLKEGATFTASSYFKVPYAQREFLKAELDLLLELGIIRYSSSDCASPVLLVPKPDGGLRMVIDYRKLNAITVSDAYPLPHLDEILDSLGRARYFASVDCTKGFLQLQCTPEASRLCAFTTPFGLYEPTRMMMGLKNSPPVWQRAMSIGLREHIGRRVHVYMDDAIIFGSTFSELLDNVELVLQSFEALNIKLNPKKSAFGVTELKFLGHVITPAGILPDGDIIRAVVDFPEPGEKVEVQRFLGLTNWQRKFIQNYARIAAPLSKLTGNVPFQFGDAEREAFYLLKIKLLSPPILRHPDLSRPFILKTDACKVGFGGILAQKDDQGREYVVRYCSKKTSGAEVNYSATDLECQAVVTFIKKLHAYLAGQKFTLITDHQALKYLMNSKDLTGKLARNALLLQEYDFDVEYRKGKEHGDVDALSRMFETEGMGAAAAAASDINVLDDAYLAWSLNLSKEQVGEIRWDREVMGAGRTALPDASTCWEEHEENPAAATAAADTAAADRPLAMAGQIQDALTASFWEQRDTASGGAAADDSAIAVAGKMASLAGELRALNLKPQNPEEFSFRPGGPARKPLTAAPSLTVTEEPMAARAPGGNSAFRIGAAAAAARGVTTSSFFMAAGGHAVAQMELLTLEPLLPSATVDSASGHTLEGDGPTPGGRADVPVNSSSTAAQQGSISGAGMSSETLSSSSKQNPTPSGPAAAPAGPAAEEREGELGANSRPFIISLEGNIGAGKSEVFKALQQHFSAAGWTVVPEPVELWDNGGVLTHYYECSKRPERDYARWKAAAYLQQTVIQSYLDMDPLASKTIMERGPFSSLLVFTPANHIHPRLEADIYTAAAADERLERVFPSAIIYISTTPELCYERILTRGRECEQDIQLTYLAELQQLYDQALPTFPGPVIYIDGSQPAQRVAEQVKEAVEELTTPRALPRSMVANFLASLGQRQQRYSTLADDMELETHRVSTGATDSGADAAAGAAELSMLCTEELSYSSLQTSGELPTPLLEILGINSEKDTVVLLQQAPQLAGGTLEFSPKFLEAYFRDGSSKILSPRQVEGNFKTLEVALSLGFKESCRQGNIAFAIVPRKGLHSLVVRYNADGMEVASIDPYAYALKSTPTPILGDSYLWQCLLGEGRALASQCYNYYSADEFLSAHARPKTPLFGSTQQRGDYRFITDPVGSLYTFTSEGDYTSTSQSSGPPISPDLPCNMCGDPGNWELMLLCSTCGEGFHTYCVGLDDVPKGAWDCRGCTKAGKRPAVTPTPPPSPVKQGGGRWIRLPPQHTDAEMMRHWAKKRLQQQQQQQKEELRGHGARSVLEKEREIGWSDEQQLQQEGYQEERLKEVWASWKQQEQQEKKERLISQKEWEELQDLRMLKDEQESQSVWDDFWEWQEMQHEKGISLPRQGQTEWEAFEEWQQLQREDWDGYQEEWQAGWKRLQQKRQRRGLGETSSPVTGEQCRQPTPAPVFVFGASRQEETSGNDIWSDEATLHFITNKGEWQEGIFSGLSKADAARESNRIQGRALRYTAVAGSEDYLYKEPTPAHPERRMVPRPEKRWELIQSLHENSGHLGITKVLSMLSRNYWFAGMKELVIKVLKACHPCAQAKADFKEDPVLHPLPPLPTFQRISMDTVGPFPQTARGNRHVIVAICGFTKWVEVAAIPDKLSSTAAHFIEGWICRYGKPREVLTDNGPEFRGEFPAMLAKYNVRHVTSSSYRPTSNGQAERTVQTVEGGLQKAAVTKPEQWDLELPSIMKGMRQGVQSSTGYSPYFLVFGCHPPVFEVPNSGGAGPSSAGAGPSSAGVAGAAAVARGPPPEEVPLPHELNARLHARSTALNAAAADAKGNILKAQEQQKRAYAKRRGLQPPDDNEVWAEDAGAISRMPVGSLVMMKVPTRGRRKLDLKAEGPYTLVAYNKKKTEVTLRDGTGREWARSTNQVAPYIPEEHERQQQQQKDPAGPSEQRKKRRR